MLTKRQVQLLQLMSLHHSFKPILYYSDQLGVTDRTLRKDVKVIENCLETPKNDLFEKFPRKGIRIKNRKVVDRIIRVGLADNKQNLINASGNMFEPFQRQLEIAKLLFLNGESVSYNKLSEQFLVSKSSITNDLKKIANITKNSNIKIQSTNLGTRVVGTESEIQNAIKKMAYYVIYNSGSNTSLNLMSYSSLLRLIPEEYLSESYDLLDEAQNYDVLSLSDNYHQSLALSLSIFIFRLKHGKHIDHSRPIIFENKQSYDISKLAQLLINSIELTFNIKCLRKDKSFLKALLIAHGIEFNLEEKDVNEYYVKIVRNFILDIDLSLKTNLAEDSILFHNLLNHMIPMVLRLRMNVPINNPYTEETKKEHAVLFSTISLLVGKYENELTVEITEDEIAFIAIHVLASIERTSAKKKILVICATGIGTSELIANKLERVLFPNDLIEIVSYRNVTGCLAKKYDLLISSIKLPFENIPIVYVSPLMTKEDLKKVSCEYLDLFYSEQTVTKQKLKYISRLIDPDVIFFKGSFNSKGELIDYLSDKLFKLHRTTKEFDQSVKEREKLGKTDLSIGVAIPHAAPETVLESCIALLKLKTPVKWNSQLIHIVFMICISEKDLTNVRDIMAEFYTLIQSKEVLDKIVKANSKNQILEAIGGIS